MTLLEQIEKLDTMCHTVSMIATEDVLPFCAKLREVVEAAELFACSYRPERLVGVPLGMHHCPYCGGMHHCPYCVTMSDMDELRNALAPMNLPRRNKKEEVG